MTDLKNKHAIVTGGGRGIGRAIADQLSAAGASVTVMGRTETTLKEFADTGDQHGYQVVDVTDEAAVVEAFAAATEARGIPDTLVNNAGAVETVPFVKMDMAVLRAMLDINLISAAHCTQQVLKPMMRRGSGRVINIASTAGLKGYAYVSGYTAAKHAIIGLTKALALETAESGVTVNSICPGFTDTDIAKDAIDMIASSTGRDAAGARAELERFNPQGRLIQPEEVAEAVLWLCSDMSGSVTGQSITIAGGEVM